MISTRKNTGFIHLLLILAIGVCSCEHFEEMNQDPYHASSVPVNTLLRPIIQNFSTSYQSNAIDLTNPLVQASTIPASDADRYKLEYYYPLWHKCFGELKNINYILEHTDHKNYHGVALILKVLMLSNVSHLYGDMPYFDAGKGREKLYQPTYDPQEALYAHMIATLEQANLYLEEDPASIESDNLYDGDVYQWRKFANAIKLRLLMMQSGQADPGPKLQEMLDDPDKFPLLESNGDQPEYFQTNLGYANAPDQTKAKKMVKTFIDFLLRTGDERIKAYADTTLSTNPEIPTYVGVPSGAVTDIGSSSSISTVSALLWNSRNKPALSIILFNYTEQALLLAEATEKGYITGAKTAQEYYEEGIKASYQNQKAVVDRGIEMAIEPLSPMKEWDEVSAGYLSHPDVIFEGTLEEKLEKIGRQMWVALYSNMDAWYHQRRTGYPLLVPGEDVQNDGKMPVRFTYPDSEKIFNYDSYQAVLDQQGTDDLNTKMWLLK